MDDSRRTRLAFLAGVLAVLLLAPVALGALSDPAAVQEGATFNANSGPAVTAGEPLSVATNTVFPDAETVQLGPTAVSGAQVATNITAAGGPLPTLRPDTTPASGGTPLQLGNTGTPLTAGIAGGTVDRLALSASATVGDSTRDIEIETGGTGTTVVVAGLTASQVVFVDTSGAQNQQLATKSVSSGQASLSVGPNADRDILLATQAAQFGVTIDSTNGPVIEGDDLTVTATVNNTGGVQATQNVTLSAGPLGTTSQNLTIAAGASTQQTFTLPTTVGDGGQQVTATVASDDVSASQAVDILRNVPVFNVTITSSNAPIAPGDTLSIQATVENEGAKNGTQDITLSTGGTVVGSETVSLAPGAQTSATFGVNSSVTAVGATATLSSDNDTIGFVAVEERWTELSDAVVPGSTGGPVAVSPDGELMAGTNGTDIIIAETRSRTEVAQFAGASSRITAIDWRPDGTRIAVGTESNLFVLDGETGGLIDTVTRAVGAAQWSPDNQRLLYHSPDTGKAYVVDADTLATQRTETVGGDGPTSTVAWSRNSQRFAAGGTCGGSPCPAGTVGIFSTGGGQVQTITVTGASSQTPLGGAALANGGQTLVAAKAKEFDPTAGTLDGTIKLFDVASGNQLDAVRGERFVSEIRAGPGGDRVVTSGGQVLAVTNGELVQTESLSTGNGGSLDWTLNGEYIVADQTDGTVFTSGLVVNGTVSDSSGAPVPGVTVELAGGGQRLSAVTTGADGAFVFTPQETGEFALTAVKDSGSQQLLETKRITVVSQRTTVPFTTTLVNTGISGRVVDQSGDAIPGASVTHNKTAQSVNATTQGEFVLDTAAGTFTVSASAPDFRSNTTTVTVVGGQVTGGVVIQLEQTTGFPITGTVTDPSGDPIAGADVFAAGQQVQTDSTGAYTLGVASTGDVTVTASTAVDSQTRAVNVTQQGATADFTLDEASDNNTQPAGNLEIRFENGGELVNNRTVTVRFFDDTQERLAVRNTSTGIIDLGSVNEQPPLVAVAEADGLFTRRIVLEDLTGDTLFLLDEQKADNQVVINEFDIVDNTGQFSDDVRFRIKRAVPLPGETDNIPLRVIGEDLLGADGRFGIALESDLRYRIQIENQDGDVRDLGPHFAVSEGPVRIEIGRVEFDRPGGETFRVDASLTERTNTTEELNFAFVDAGRFTDSVALEIYERSNESNVLVDQTFEPETGDNFGAFLFSEVLSGNDTGKTWVVEYSAARNETQDGLFTVSATGGNLGIPIDQGIQQILGVGMVIVLAGLFSTRNAAIGAIVVPLAAGTLWFLGFLTGATTGASIALGLALGVAYNFATGGV